MQMADKVAKIVLPAATTDVTLFEVHAFQRV